MIYYISDLHFGHTNIIKMCNRPFKDIEEMNSVLIQNWNKKVHKNDDVYILGDMFFKMKDNIEDVLKALKGKKHLILGNHDKSWIYKVDPMQYFVEVTPMLVFSNGKNKITLCHFPMMDYEGDYQIYGHIHNNKDDFFWSLLKTMDNSLNAGADINNFEPVTFEELLLNNKKFKNE